MRTSYPQICVQDLPNPDLQKVCLLPNVQYDFGGLTGTYAIGRSFN